MRVLVTGGLGFTGRVVADELHRHGHTVTVLTHSDSVRPPSMWPLVHADLRDRAAIAQIVADGVFDGVCHLAALTRVRDSLADPVTYFDVNVNGTLNLLAALERLAEQDTTSGRGRRVPRLVFGSTAAVYGHADGELSEDAPAVPVNPYGASKRAAEQLIGFQAATGRLAAVTLRCFNVAGAVAAPDPDTTRIIPKALAVARGDFDRVQINGDGSAIREYTHVADVAAAYRLALEGARESEHLIYNVGSGQGTSVADIVGAVRRVTGHPVPVEHLFPKPEPAVLIADGKRIRADLGWVPARSAIDRLVSDGWRALGSAGT